MTALSKPYKLKRSFERVYDTRSKRLRTQLDDPNGAVSKENTFNTTSYPAFSSYSSIHQSNANDLQSHKEVTAPNIPVVGEEFSSGTLSPAPSSSISHDQSDSDNVPSLSLKRRLICEKCPQRFNSRSEILNHCIELHDTDLPYSCGLCEKQFELFNARNKHKKIHFKTYSFTCDHLDCSAAFNTKSGLKDHNISHAKERPHKCIYCVASFKRVSDRKRHETVKHSNQPKLHRCDECSRLVTRLEEHRKIHSEERRHKCDIGSCDYTCKRLTDLRKHKLKNKKIHLAPSELKEKDDDRLVCKQCEKSFQRRDSLKRHQDRYCTGVSHKNRRCPDCEFTCETHSELLNHAKSTHNTNLIYECECGKRFPKVGKLNLHVKDRHSDQTPLACTFTDCNKNFPSQIRLDRHLRTHSRRFKHECDLCHNLFATKWSLKDHNQRVHSDARSHSCTLCGHSAKTKSDLKKHQNSCVKKDEATREKAVRLLRWQPELILISNGSYGCPICWNTFEDRDYAEYHRGVHLRPGQHKCENCGKACNWQSSLSEHQSKYCKGPYRCKQCGEMFTERTELQSHKKTHKMVLCDRCRSVFENHDELKEHCAVIHKTKEPYLCGCGYSFTTKFGRKNHQILCGEDHLSE